MIHSLKKTKSGRTGLALFLLVFFFGFPQVFAEDLMIAAGAGYKRPVQEIIDSFTVKTGLRVSAIFGNLQMVASQAKESGEVATIIGDKKFLKQLEGTVSFSSYAPLGKGILVLAFRKGLEMKSVSEIQLSAVKSVFMPEEGKAIYGIAGKEVLENLGYLKTVAPKLTQVATVPQVVSYLLTGEADVGFINLTEAIASRDKLGGYLVVDAKAYKAIDIVAGTVKGFEEKPANKQFIEFLKTPTVQTIARKHGL